MKFIQAVLIVIVLVLAVAIAAVIYFGSYPLGKEEILDDEETRSTVILDAALYQEMLAAIDRSEALSGEVFITAIPKQENTTTEPFDENGELLPRDTYRYEVATGNITKSSLPYPVWYVNHWGPGYQLFVAQPVDETIYRPTLFLNSFLSDGPKKIGIPEYNIPEGVSIIDRRFPRWSSDGKNFLYSALTKSASSSETEASNINNWQVYVGGTYLDTKTAFFAAGYGAVWAEDNKHLIYVKDDGIYGKPVPMNETGTSTDTEFLLIKSDHPFTLRHEIQTSPDGRYLVVPYPIYPSIAKSYIEVYKLKLSEVEPIVQPVMRIFYHDDYMLFRPVVSYGGRYLFMLAGKEGGENSRALVYDLISGEFVSDRTFDDYYLDYSLISDWVPESGL